LNKAARFVDSDVHNLISKIGWLVSFLYHDKRKNSCRETATS
jgi:hypothetical protein